MFGTQLPFAELHQSLLEYVGNDAYRDVIDGWLNENHDQHDWISDFRHRTNDTWGAATPEDLAQLYAVFRVTSILLLRFQERLDADQYAGPCLSMEDICQFHERLGFQVRFESSYHPFFHEILLVYQASNADTPPKIERCVWPTVMLGKLLFCRAGCIVSAGSNHAIQSIVANSTLYWTYRRNDRPCDDLSHGWGHNSQWRTSHRRDYFDGQKYHYNVDGECSLNEPDAKFDDLSRSTCLELLRNRCLTTTKLDDRDLWPYDLTYVEDAHGWNEVTSVT